MLDTWLKSAIVVLGIWFSGLAAEPEQSVDPLLVALEGLPIERAQHLAPGTMRLHYSGPSQDAKMPGYQRLTEPQRLAELCYRHSLVERQILKDPEPLPVAHRPEIDQNVLHAQLYT